MRSRPPTGLALDLGSSRIRLCTPAQRRPLDIPPVPGPPLVSRGRIVDVRGAAGVLAEVLAELRITRAQLTVVATTPVLCGDAHREDVRTLMAEAGAATVVMIEGVKAAALGAGMDLSEPLLVADVGAQLTEIALLAEGAVVEARRTLLGLHDRVPAAVLVEVIGDAVLELLRGERGPQVADALDRGVLLAGGGGLRPEITYKLGRRLGIVVGPAPAPHTVAVRGAASVVHATGRHPGVSRRTFPG
ncbi:rod shape-determining protein [Kribbella shirazensis]|uniref:Rod shape-determining protein MreB n=1 Tax=Kribbella shirazensis TaxID=1105143 RepID=A0A7X5VAW8_9ACTN|nr:rod shape-determining protein [Kribbella shirazensis]NIK57777.1 rod shape-determining protein MreB [Kribbella shirazensis]